MGSKENVEVTVRLDAQGVYQPLSFRWNQKTFRVLETVARWKDGDADHLLVLVGPINNQHELIREADGRWYLETSHAQDTLVQGETAYLAKVARKIVVNEVTLGNESGFESQHRVLFETPRTVDYRADVQDIAKYLMLLMTDAALREKLGKAARKRVVEHFDYRAVAKQFVELMNDAFGVR